MQIRYPWFVWAVIGFNAALCLLLAISLEQPLNIIFYVVAGIAALQAVGFATAMMKLDDKHVKLRHFLRSEIIAKADINQVDAKNFRTVLLVLKNGDTKQLPAFGLDSFRTAKTIKAWLLG